MASRKITSPRKPAAEAKAAPTPRRAAAAEGKAAAPRRTSAEGKAPAPRRAAAAGGKAPATRRASAAEGKAPAPRRAAAAEGKAPAARRASAAEGKAPATGRAAAEGRPSRRPAAGLKAPSRKKTAATVEKRSATTRKAPVPGTKKAHVVEAAGKALEAPAAALAAARIAADAALDKKAENVVILDVAGLTGYADCFVIATGTSDRQVSAIADSIEEKMKKAGHRPIGVEGHGLGHWVLLDFGDVVAHVFYEEARALYDVEGLWADARRILVE